MNRSGRCSKVSIRYYLPHYRIMVTWVQAFLWQTGQQLIGLPDPAGGTFDGAGDFDPLLTRRMRASPCSAVSTPMATFT
jgi:hypothetical protein